MLTVAVSLFAVSLYGYIKCVCVFHSFNCQIDKHFGKLCAKLAVNFFELRQQQQKKIKKTLQALEFFFFVIVLNNNHNNNGYNVCVRACSYKMKICMSK